jgi:Fur family transcriptional regulator, ferric uptake regulator
MIAATQSNHPLASITSPHERRSAVEIACATLRQRGLRITKPRVALLEELLRHQRPASIEDIHRAVCKNGCDLVTVYRCLAVFEEAGLVHRSFRHSGTVLFHIATGSAARYHVACKHCGASEPVEYFPAEGMERMLAARGYTSVSHSLEFFGVCPACSAQAARQAILTAPAREAMPHALDPHE